MARVEPAAIAGPHRSTVTAIVDLALAGLTKLAARLSDDSGAGHVVEARDPTGEPPAGSAPLAQTLARFSTADLDSRTGDPTEPALLEFAATSDVRLDVSTRDADRVVLYPCSVGLTTNRLLLAGLAFELAFAAVLIYVPALQPVFGTAALPAWVIALLLPIPLLVWGADELFRWAGRRHTRGLR